MDLPKHDANGRPLSERARAELMALPAHLRCQPAVVSLANAPDGPPLPPHVAAELENRMRSQDRGASHEEILAALGDRRRAEEPAAE